MRWIDFLTTARPRPAPVADVRAVQQWFHAMRLPAPIAQSIYSEVERMSLEQ